MQPTAPVVDAGRLQSLIETGGPVVAILLALSVVALAVILLKLWQFIAIRIGSRKFIDQALHRWREGNAKEALAALDGVRNPIAGVMALAMRGRMDKNVPESVVREEASRVAVENIETLRGQFRILEVIGALSPLLGLLGTVLGMIEAFRQLEMAGSQVDPALLSGGIWVALLTTAVGLAVAIPVVAALNALERVLDRFRHRMEDAVTQVFTIPLPSGGETSGAVPFERARRVADAH
ncbi:flagellar motor protein MotA [Alkalilimnicola ehrlichii]|uniref:Flagellar motor protein MotA n=1 Tax=Alkalilimnicola ehrlichii TaxID=351052 RepID=A0A3E0WLD2_9GAMM|nr:MotA/TolQ/ExbB proton channel family protein [Alkalilimnicola ehrlichii]RFA24658.1 flagellar motor protein MotA [Alkalilimnicola ehrlichii]RFA33764.1 flagellar motor protein MotA [Alkalilimnicola ehrlichii]